MKKFSIVLSVIALSFASIGLAQTVAPPQTQATLQDVYDAMVAADAAGDTVKAKKLALLIDEIQPRQNGKIVTPAATVINGNEKYICAHYCPVKTQTKPIG